MYHAPQFKGLNIEQMLSWASQYPEVAAALPSESTELEKLHRDYVSSVIYTIVGQPFVVWVQSKVEERNQHIQESQDKNVMLDPEIAQILQASHAISVSKGISNNLLKVSNGAA